jgi:hypothetical protein
MRNYRVGFLERYTHLIIVFCLSWLLSFNFWFWPAALAITSMHFLNDYLFKIFKINLFFTNQLIHLVIIFSAVVVYMYLFDFKLPFVIDSKYPAIILGYIICTKHANIVIKNIFRVFEIPVPGQSVNNDEGLPNAGKLIGITERILA